MRGQFMPIKTIVITIESSPSAPGDSETRVLTFDRETKRWVGPNGLYPGEIKFLGALDKVRQEYVV